MKISVIIPVYNVENYIEQCVDSVIALKSNVEILLVDDGSKDKSSMLCDEFAARDPRITVIHKENGGLSSARNAGIKVATGDYLLFIDSDDFIDPQSTDKMLCELESKPDILMGMYRNYYTDTASSEPENSVVFKDMNGLYKIESFLSKIPADGKTDYITAWRFIVKSDLINENGLLFFEGIYHEDEEWSQRLFLKAKNIFVKNEYFYLYRQAREGAITATVKPKNIFDRFIILEKTIALETECKEEIEKEYLRSRAGQLLLSNMLNYHILNGDDKLKAITLIRKYSDYLRYIPTKKAAIMRSFKNIFGAKVTCWILGIVAKLK